MIEEFNRTIPRSIYARDGWTVVRFADYFEKNGIESDEAYKLMKGEYKTWLTENVDKENWEFGGVTKFSYRIQFRNEIDALAFKLRFGIF